MTELIETLLLGAATVALFVYGAAQRHLMKKVTTELGRERTKNENERARHEECLTSLQADIAKSRSLLEEAQNQKAEVVAEIADLKQQKRELQEYLATEDGRKVNQAALEKVAKLKAEIQSLNQKREDFQALREGVVLGLAPYFDDMKVSPSLRVLVPECERVWRQAPGTLLQITSGAGTWTGTTPASLLAYIDYYSARSWVGNGVCTLSVAR